MTSNVSTILKVSAGSPEYPESLLNIPKPPKEIYYRGELPRRGEKIIAIVGTRKATSEGKIYAKEIAKELAKKGITIISGLALGIDGAAHEGALKGEGKTIAVLGNGLQEIYPRSHERLGQEIINSGGGLVSEYPAGTPALPHHFLERNRIVSGLAEGVIVIEAGMRSGSLVTAKCALEQGKEVFVVPGPPDHPNYEGSHYLIRNGARLVRNANDIFEDLGINITSQKSIENLTPGEEKNNFDETTKTILQIIATSKNGLSLDDIAEKTNTPIHLAAQKISGLVISNLIKEETGIFSLKR